MVRVAPSGRQALDMLEQESTDVMVLDQKMPEKAGLTSWSYILRISSSPSRGHHVHRPSTVGTRSSRASPWGPLTTCATAEGAGLAADVVLAAGLRMFGKIRNTTNTTS
jgi:CheY-like chemotaxis protein